MAVGDTEDHAGCEAIDVSLVRGWLVQDCGAEPCSFSFLDGLVESEGRLVQPLMEHASTCLPFFSVWLDENARIVPV